MKLLLKILKLVVLKKSPKLACNDKWNTFRINVKPGFHMIAVIAAIAEKKKFSDRRIYGHFVPWSDRSKSDRSTQKSDRSTK